MKPDPYKQKASRKYKASHPEARKAKDGKKQTPKNGHERIQNRCEDTAAAEDKVEIGTELEDSCSTSNPEENNEELGPDNSQLERKCYHGRATRNLPSNAWRYEEPEEQLEEIDEEEMRIIEEINEKKEAELQKFLERLKTQLSENGGTDYRNLKIHKNSKDHESQLDSEDEEIIEKLLSIPYHRLVKEVSPQVLKDVFGIEKNEFDGDRKESASTRRAAGKVSLNAGNKLEGAQDLIPSMRAASEMTIANKNPAASSQPSPKAPADDLDEWLDSVI
ncbi:hypothetical protein H4219_001954 [Mycoemilia scoparia]|uniref:Uncharacterized protein n=1 Tax=Mycoemilia scoparia TaxID=417184 RepID=A0A9W7ZZN7_9FUNG|nr:hypothetical protein H4219_001954 [Mycoemilia scoparia]